MSAEYQSKGMEQQSGENQRNVRATQRHSTVSHSTDSIEMIIQIQKCSDCEGKASPGKVGLGKGTARIGIDVQSSGRVRR